MSTPVSVLKRVVHDIAGVFKACGWYKCLRALGQRWGPPSSGEWPTAQAPLLPSSDGQFQGIARVKRQERRQLFETHTPACQKGLCSFPAASRASNRRSFRIHWWPGRISKCIRCSKARTLADAMGVLVVVVVSVLVAIIVALLGKRLFLRKEAGRFGTKPAPTRPAPTAGVTPRSVNYHYTRKCNYKCGFCFHTATTSYYLPLEDAKRGLALLKDKGIPGIPHRPIRVVFFKNNQNPLNIVDSRSARVEGG